MTIRKIPDWTDALKGDFCRSKEHDPPTMIVLPPGTYEHECSECHQKTTFIIDRPTLSDKEWLESSTTV